MHIKTLSIAAALVALSIPRLASANTALTPADELAWKAARALYGEGLAIKRSKSEVSISGGSLTQKAWDRYVKEVYLPTLQRVSVSRTGTHFRWARGYADNRWDLRGATKRAHIVLEPYFKYALCEGIAKAIGLKPSMSAFEERKAWCAYQSMREGLAPIYEYRGKDVTWAGKRVRGVLDIDETIFRADSAGHYPIVITVAGGREMVSRPGINIATEMIENVDADFAPKIHAKANRYWKKKVRGYHKIEAKLKAKQRRLAGGKVAFSSEPFYNWVVNEPAKGTLSCDSVYTLTYGPKKARRDGYAVAFSVDDTVCVTLPMEPKERFASDFHYSARCSGLFRPGAVHTLRVNVHNDVVTGKYDRVELDKRDLRFKKRTYKLSRLGKKRYGSTIKCKAP